MPLPEHLNTIVYIIVEILQFNKVKLATEDNNSIIIEKIEIIRLRKIVS